MKKQLKNSRIWGIILCLSLPVLGWSTNYYSIQNGNYNNAATWLAQAPITIPEGDTVFINHTVTLTQDIRIRGVLYIGSSGKVTGNGKLNNDDVDGVLINFGEIDILDEIHIDGSWYNYGYSISEKVHNDGYICNYGTIEIDPDEEWDQHGGELDCGGTVKFCKMEVHDGVQGISKFTNINLDTCSLDCPETYIDFDDPADIDTMNVEICGLSLPIELISFNVWTVGTRVELFWQTATEYNNDYFVVERSIDGYNWEFVQKINGAGTSSTLIRYQAIDQSPHAGLSYYRLKQTDYDGTYAYSQIRSVNVSGPSNSIFIYPNPVENKIFMEGDETEFDQISIFNILGQDVSFLTTVERQAGQLVIINMTELGKGVYFIKTKSNIQKIYKD